MPKSSFAVPNPLGQQQAKQLLDTFMPHVQEKFKDMIKDVEQSWAGDDLSFSFRTLGMIVAPCSVRTMSEIATGVTVKVIKGMITEVRAKGEPAAANDAKS